MNKERADFNDTPNYDDFLETREDVISRFIELYDAGFKGSASTVREELEKILHRFEVENQEQIIHSRNTADERKRRKIEHIISEEGTLYDRINVDFFERGSVLDHELAVQHAELLSKGTSGVNHHASADLLNRKTRLIPQATNQNCPHLSQIAEASGCHELWKKRALEVLIQSFA
jgi:hypothetical protein